VAKIVRLAGFYNGLHNDRYIFDDKRDEVISSRDLSFFELNEGLANIGGGANNLSNATQATRKVVIKNNSESIQCTAFIEYSINSPQSPQVLANVKLYNCKSESGTPRPGFHFTYNRLEVSRIMRGVE
jgi:hypothetical protein